MTAPGGGTTITVTVTLHDYLSVPAGHAARATENLKDQIKQLNRALLLLDKRLDKVTQSLMRYVLAARLAAGATDSFRNAVIQLNASLHITSTSIHNINNRLNQMSTQMNRANLSMNRLNRNTNVVRKVFVRLNNVAGAATKTLKGMAIVFGVLAGGAAIGQAVQQSLVFIQMLMQLVAFAGLIPIALGSIIGVVGTLVLAFKGFGAGLSALGASQSEFNDAIKGLAPAAQSVLRILRTFVPQFKALKTAVQQEFFAPIALYVKGMMTNLMPIISSGMKQVAGTLGKAFASIVQFFNTSKGAAMFDSLFKGANMFAGMLDRVLYPMLQGLSDVMVATLPAWDRLMDALGDAGQRFGTWMTEISNNGQLAAMLDAAFEAAKVLWSMLSAIVGIFGDIMKAASAAGGFGLDIFLNKIREFTSSPEGQAAFTNFFVAVGQIAVALVPVISALAVAIGHLAPAIGPIVSSFGPALVVIIQALDSALQVLMPLWGPLADAIALVVMAFAPLIEAIGPFVATAMGTLTMALQGLLAILQPVIMVVSAFVSQFGTIFMNTMSSILPVLTELFTQLGTVLFSLVPPIMQIVTMFADAFVPLFTAVAEIVAQAAPVILEFASAIASSLIIALETLMPYLPGLFQGFTSILMALLQLLPALLPVISAFSTMIVTMQPAIPFFALMVAAIINVIAFFMRLVATIVGNSVSIIAAVANIVNWVVTNFGRIKDAMAKPFEDARSRIMGVISAISGAIGGLVSKVEGLMSKISGLNPFRAFGGPVQAGTTYTVGEMGKELFVPDVGKPYMIGEGGQEDRRFATSGMVIPNYLVEAMERVGNQAQRHAAALEKQGAGDDQYATYLARQRKPKGGDETTNFNFSFAGANFNKDIDVERAVEKGIEKAMKKYNQQRKERV